MKGSHTHWLLEPIPPAPPQRQEEIGRTRCEVYSRVVGFLSPVSQWNKGKKAEWVDRTTWDGNGEAVRSQPSRNP
jgi:hypothetical protein